MRGGARKMFGKMPSMGSMFKKSPAAAAPAARPTKNARGVSPANLMAQRSKLRAPDASQKARDQAAAKKKAEAAAAETAAKRKAEAEVAAKKKAADAEAAAKKKAEAANAAAKKKAADAEAAAKKKAAAGQGMGMGSASFGNSGASAGVPNMNNGDNDNNNNNNRTPPVTEPGNNNGDEPVSGYPGEYFNADAAAAEEAAAEAAAAEEAARAAAEEEAARAAAEAAALAGMDAAAQAPTLTLYIIAQRRPGNTGPRPILSLETANRILLELADAINMTLGIRTANVSSPRQLTMELDNEQNIQGVGVYVRGVPVARAPGGSSSLQARGSDIDANLTPRTRELIQIPSRVKLMTYAPAENTSLTGIKSLIATNGTNMPPGVPFRLAPGDYKGIMSSAKYFIFRDPFRKTQAANVLIKTTPDGDYGFFRVTGTPEEIDEGIQKLRSSVVDMSTKDYMQKLQANLIEYQRDAEDYRQRIDNLTSEMSRRTTAGNVQQFRNEIIRTQQLQSEALDKIKQTQDSIQNLQNTMAQQQRGTNV
jgi:hypothetical protein